MAMVKKQFIREGKNLVILSLALLFIIPLFLLPVGAQNVSTDGVTDLRYFTEDTSYASTTER